MLNGTVVDGKVIELMSGKLAICPVLPITTMVIICVVILLLKRRGLFPFIRQIIVVLLLFALNLRIMIPDDNMTVTQQNLDAYVLFVVDDTISMYAEDYNGENRRLDAVKKDCEHIINELDGAKFAVVSFNNNSQLMAPYSDDGSFTKSVINSITPLQELYASGTSLNICKDNMVEMLENARNRDSGIVVLFFISDGEITAEDEELDSFEEAKEFVDYGAVMGYGTTEGGYMYVSDYDDELEQVMDERDWSDVKPAVSVIDESNLKSIASDIGVDYVHMTKQNNIDDVLDDIKKATESETVEKVQKNYHETYYLFVIPIAFMIVLEFILLKRKK